MKLSRRHAFAVAACLAWPAQAQTQAPSATAAISLTDRVNWARTLSEDLRRLSPSIPNLSPAEVSFVEREHREALAASGGKYSPRLLKLMDGREYNIREAADWTTRAARNATEISIAADLKAEVLFWSRLAGAYTDRAGLAAVYALRTLGIVEDKDMLVAPSLASSLELFLANTTHTGHSIIEKIITPYLEDKLPA